MLKLAVFDNFPTPPHASKLWGDLENKVPNKAITPTEYIRANFQTSDRIAIVVRNPKRGETTQRISTTAKVTDTPFQDWMRYKSEMVATSTSA